MLYKNEIKGIMCMSCANQIKGEYIVIDKKWRGGVLSSAMCQKRRSREAARANKIYRGGLRIDRFGTVESSIQVH